MKFKNAFCIFAAIFAANIAYARNHNFLAPHQIKEITLSIPTTDEAFEKYCKQTLESCELQLKEIKALPKRKQTFESTIGAWDLTGRHYFCALAMMLGIKTFSHDPKMVATLEGCIDRLNLSVFAQLHDEAALQVIYSYIEKQLQEENLSQTECYYYQAFLKNSSYLPGNCRKKIEELLPLFEKKQIQDFTFREGNLATIKNESPTISLLTWNVSFLPGHLSIIFGGVVPWKYRLDMMTRQILKINPDVLCLQELFDPQGADALYKKLKASYPYFYYHIAPHNFGVAFDELCMGSGIFIASKFKIISPCWVRFEAGEGIKNVERGVFDFTICSKDDRLQILTTHLESSVGAGMEEKVRESQLKQILLYLENESRSIPVCLCGDFNVSYGKDEPAEKIIHDYFLDPFPKTTAITGDNCTFTDYTFFWLNPSQQDFKPELSILDYSLQLRKLPSGKKIPTLRLIEAQRIEANHCLEPWNALSDHHALLTIYQFENSGLN